MQELCLQKLGNRWQGVNQQDPGIREKDVATVGDVVEWVRTIPWEPGRARPSYAGTSVGDQDPHVFGPPGSGSGSFPFLINVLSGLIKYLQNIILAQNFSQKFKFLD
jgi:hypothetical protein